MGHKRLGIKVYYRTVENVEFIVYDGIHFRLMPYLLDIIVSVWAVQCMDMARLKRTVSELPDIIYKKTVLLKVAR